MSNREVLENKISFLLKHIAAAKEYQNKLFDVTQFIEHIQQNVL